MSTEAENIIALQKEIELLKDKIKEMGGELIRVRKVGDDFEGKMEGMGRVSKKLKDTQKELNHAYEDAVDAYSAYKQSIKDGAKNVEELKAAYKNAEKAVIDQNNAIRELRSLEKDVAKAIDAATDSEEKNTAAKKKNKEAQRKSVAALKNLTSKMIGYTAAFGMQGIGIKKITQLTMKYNQSLFSLSKVNQIMGRDSMGLSSALKEVTDSTALSNIEFLGFANSLSMGYKGIAPTIGGIKDMAIALDKQFGPGIENATRYLQAFLQLQSKFPAAAALAMRGLELAKTKNRTSSQEKELNLARSVVSTMVSTRQIGGESYKLLAQSMSETTDKQADQVGLNRDMMVSIRDVENMMLKFGKTSESALKAAAKETSLISQGLSSIPVAAIAATTSIEAIGIVAQISAVRAIGSFAALTVALKETAAAAIFASGATASIGSPTAIPKSPTAIPKSPTRPVAAPIIAGKFGGKFGSRLLGPALMAIPVGIMSYSAEHGERQGEGAVVQRRAAATRSGIAAGIPIAAGIIGSFLPGGRITGTILSGVTSLVSDTIAKQFTNYMFGKPKGDIGDGVGAGAGPLDEFAVQAQELEAQRANLETRLEILKQSSEAQSKMVSLIKDYGVISSKNIGQLERQVELTSQIESSSKEFLGSQFEKMYKAPLKGIEGIDTEKMFKDTAGLDELEKAESWINDLSSAQLQLKSNAEKYKIELEASNTTSSRQAEILTNLKHIEMERFKVDGAINAILTARSTILDAQRQKVEAGLALAYSEADQMEKMNASVMSRLETQQRLYESAQFGMGASVTMMQKQVDLLMRMIQSYDKLIPKERERIAGLAGINVEQVKQLENMEFQGDALDYINQITKGNEGAQKILNQHYIKFQQQSESVMRLQQKIYDITKSMREGYLDVISEMAINAGEFTKIIATQEMGISQVMKLTKQVSGEYKGNTMKTGGMGYINSPAMRARMKTSGKYTIGGATGFTSPADQETINRAKAGMGGIWNYGQSEIDFERMRRGEGGGYSEVGAASGIGEDKQYIRPEMDELRIQTQATKMGVVQAAREIGNGIIGTLYGVRQPVLQGNAPGQEKTNPAHGAEIASYSANLAGKAQGQPAAQPPDLYLGGTSPSVPGMTTTGTIVSGVVGKTNKDKNKTSKTMRDKVRDVIEKYNDQYLDADAKLRVIEAEREFREIEYRQSQKKRDRNARRIRSIKEKQDIENRPYVDFGSFKITDENTVRNVDALWKIPFGVPSLFGFSEMYSNVSDVSEGIRLRRLRYERERKEEENKKNEEELRKKQSDAKKELDWAIKYENEQKNKQLPIADAMQEFRAGERASGIVRVAGKASGNNKQGKNKKFTASMAAGQRMRDMYSAGATKSQIWAGITGSASDINFSNWTPEFEKQYNEMVAARNYAVETKRGGEIKFNAATVEAERKSKEDKNNAVSSPEVQAEYSRKIAAAGYDVGVTSGASVTANAGGTGTINIVVSFTGEAEKWLRASEDLYSAAQ